jgi:hypothetical protein
MCGAIPPLRQYAFVAWLWVKAQGQLYLTFTPCTAISNFYVLHSKRGPWRNTAVQLLQLLWEWRGCCEFLDHGLPWCDEQVVFTLQWRSCVCHALCLRNIPLLLNGVSVPGRPRHFCNVLVPLQRSLNIRIQLHKRVLPALECMTVTELRCDVRSKALWCRCISGPLTS